MKPIWEFISRDDWNRHLESAILEDFGQGEERGDHSSEACFRDDDFGQGILRAKADGIIAGTALLPSIFERLHSDISWHPHVQDGDRIEAGQILGTANGPTKALLGAERTALNYLQRLSGIATYTHHCMQLVAHTGVRLLDTRKTTPGWRALEKWAIQVGGGSNHRMGLYDYIMLKDNHIDAVGSISEAVRRASNYLEERHLKRGIEVEARTMADVREAMTLPEVDRIMLDNFTPEACREAVDEIGNRKETEASGGITEVNLRAYADSGVTYISLGALTHSVKSLDIHFKVKSL